MLAEMPAVRNTFQGFVTDGVAVLSDIVMGGRK